MDFILNFIHFLVAQGMKYLEAVIPRCLKEEKKTIKIFYPQILQQISTIILLVFWCIPDQSPWTGKWCHGGKPELPEPIYEASRHNWVSPTVHHSRSWWNQFCLSTSNVMSTKDEEDVGWTGQGMISSTMWYPTIPRGFILHHTAHVHKYVCSRGFAC